MSNIDNDGEKKDKKPWEDGKFHAYRYVIRDGKMIMYIDDEKVVDND